MPKPGYTASFRYGPGDAEDVNFVASLFGGNQTKGIIQAIKELARRKSTNQMVKQSSDMDKVEMLIETPMQEWNECLSKKSAADNSTVCVKTMDINKLANKHWKEKYIQPKAVVPIVITATTTMDSDTDGEEVVGDDGEELVL